MLDETQQIPVAPLTQSEKAKSPGASAAALLPLVSPSLSLEAAVKFFFSTMLEQIHLIRYCKEPGITDAWFFSPLLINNDIQISWVHSIYHSSASQRHSISKISSKDVFLWLA